MIKRLNITDNETTKLTENCGKLNNNKKDTNDFNNDDYNNLDKQHIDISKPQHIQAITQPLDAIKNSDNYLAFINQYEQDFKQIHKILKSFINIASPIYPNETASAGITNLSCIESPIYLNDKKDPIVISKLTIILNNNDIQNLIQSFQSKVNYAELYFNNLQAIQIIEENHKNLGNIIKLVTAIGFYSALYNKIDEALAFCQQLSQFIKEKRDLALYTRY